MLVDWLSIIHAHLHETPLPATEDSTRLWEELAADVMRCVHNVRAAGIAAEADGLRQYIHPIGFNPTVAMETVLTLATPATAVILLPTVAAVALCSFTTHAFGT